MADENKNELTIENITALFDQRLAEVTNGYDKKLEKHVGKHISPIIDDLKAQITKGLKPKKLAKLMRRMEEAKEGKENKKEKTKDQVKTPAELEADRLAAEATARDNKKKDKDKDKDRDDYFKKRQRDEFEDRIKALETENASQKAIAEEAQRMSALDRALSDLPWANLESRDMARDYYSTKLKRNDDGDLVIGDRNFAEHIKAEIPTKFENLLAPANKGGSGLRKGSEKPGKVDIDALTSANSTAEQKAEASRAIATLMGA